MLYRVGETRGGAATYTPRMVFFERRGAMGGASAAGYLYGDESGTDGGPLPLREAWTHPRFRAARRTMRTCETPCLINCWYTAD